MVTHKISELIVVLQHFKDDHGDLPVCILDGEMFHKGIRSISKIDNVEEKNSGAFHMPEKAILLKEC